MQTKILLNPENNKELIALYERAFTNASEILLATAFLTDWGFKVNLNKKCQKFLAIVGTNFGLTRKKACQKIYDWLPKDVRYEARAFRVKPGKTFHPKILVWKESESFFALVGSSNLTSAAMNSNFEVNSFSEIEERQYNSISNWFSNCFYDSEKIEPTWIEKYIEADLKNCRSLKVSEEKESVFDLKLVLPKNFDGILKRRRKQCENFRNLKDDLLVLFERCASISKKEGASQEEFELTETQFWEHFSKLWSNARDVPEDKQFRFQGGPIAITCAKSRWSESTEALLQVVEVEKSVSLDDLDSFVSKRIDYLASKKNPARGAWFSEMLCQFFPNYYPVINEPVENWIKDLDWKFESGLSEGEWYIELSRRMRCVVRQNTEFVNNIAELDHVIWAIEEEKKSD